MGNLGAHANEEYKYVFKSACPSCDSNKGPYYWVHENCGGHQKMNDWGYIRCDKCYTKGLICHWLFDCGCHNDGFRVVRGQRILCVMATIGGMYGLDEKADEIYENYKREKASLE